MVTVQTNLAILMKECMLCTAHPYLTENVDCHSVPSVTKAMHAVQSNLHQQALQQTFKPASSCVELSVLQIWQEYWMLKL